MQLRLDGAQLQDGARVQIVLIATACAAHAFTTAKKLHLGANDVDRVFFYASFVSITILKIATSLWALRSGWL